MACGCNEICGSNHCPANVACYGYQPPCPENLFDFSTNPINSVDSGILIEAIHINDLENAINNERVHPTRRGASGIVCPPNTASQACAANCSDSYTFTGSRGIGDEIGAGHFNNVVSANDGASFATIFTDGSFNIGDLITALKVYNLQNTINQTRHNCICDSHASCNPDCCNIYCPGDDTTY
jgi:hypothetical protein